MSVIEQTHPKVITCVREVGRERSHPMISSLLSQLTINYASMCTVPSLRVGFDFSI